MDAAPKNRLTSLIGAYCETDASPDDRRRITFLILLAATAVLLLLFTSILALHHRNLTLASVDAATALVIFFNLALARKQSRREANIRVGFACISILFAYLYFSGGNVGLAYMWYFLYPPLSCYLVGWRSGSLASGLMLLPVFYLLFVQPASHHAASYSLSFVWRFVFIYTMIAVFAGLYERNREQHHMELNAINRSLENLVSKRTLNLADANAKLNDEIEKRRQANRSLMLSQEILTTVLDSIDANIYVADLETHEILFMNRRIKEVYGDFVGKPCWKAFMCADGPCETCTNSELVDTGDTTGGLQTWERENPHTGNWYIHYERAIRWIDGRLVRVQIAVDITSHKEAEKQLRQAHKMESIGILSGGIAHDFNNLLGIIIGNMELALDDIPRSNPAHTNLEEIKKAGLRASEIVQRLLSFSREKNDEYMPMALPAAIGEALRFLRTAIPASIDIQFSDGGCGNVMISGEETQIHQIMMNLVTNAAQAMGENKGRIRISMSTLSLEQKGTENSSRPVPEKYVKITVSDNGPGIEAAILEQVFDPYFTTKEVGKGSGMGLAVVHAIVKKHGGDITVRSVVGQGATFTILFPQIEERPETGTAGEEPLPTGNEHILLVDDEVSLLDIVEKMLRRLGYEVLACQHPEKALACFAADPDAFQLIITDMAMPEMNGVSLCAAAKFRRPSIPVIVCTGHSRLIAADNAQESGFSGYIAKPVLVADLACAVRQVLDGRPQEPDRLPGEPVVRV